MNSSQVFIDRLYISVGHYQKTVLKSKTYKNVADLTYVQQNSTSALCSYLNLNFESTGRVETKDYVENLA